LFWARVPAPGRSLPHFAAIQEEAQSELPAVGYTVPYAIGNIVLTAWGPVLVAMMS